MMSSKIAITLFHEKLHEMGKTLDVSMLNYLGGQGFLQSFEIAYNDGPYWDEWVQEITALLRRQNRCMRKLAYATFCVRILNNALALAQGNGKTGYCTDEILPL